MKFLRSNQRVIVALAVVLVLVFSISYTSRPRNGVTVLEVFLMELLAPVQAVTERAIVTVQGTVEGVAQLSQLQDENERLRRQLAEMEQLDIEFRELRRENLELKRYLGLVSGESGEIEGARIVVTARVVGRNPDNWFKYVVVNKGSNDGVTLDMVALVPPKTLVGRVIKVTPRTSTIMLLTDPESGVGGLALGSLDAGVVLGAQEPGGLLEMQFFSREARPYRGQVVVTSGLGGVFPRGLLIGSVQEAGSGRQGVLPLGYLNPYADLDHLDYLIIAARVD